MKKSQAIVLTVLALAFGSALATPVSQQNAGLAVRAWTVKNGRFRNPVIQSATTLTTTNGVSFHSFIMRGGGTVIVAGDTELQPVIAFSSNDIDLSTIDRRSPLWALLNADLSSRIAAKTNTVIGIGTVTPGSRSGLSLGNASAEAAEFAEDWSALIAEGAAIAARPSTMDEEEEPEGPFEPGDIRVAPLVKSQWAQKDGGENWFTPNPNSVGTVTPGDTKNVVCGCVATAMSQVMRYHEYPNVAVTSITRQCFWDNYKDYRLKLTTQAGAYDWSKMPLENHKGEITDEQKAEIGKLTSDAGISVYMDYTTGESGAFAFDIGDALRSVWQYGSAVFFAPGTNPINVPAKPTPRMKALKSVFFSNFDAGLPVIISVSGEGGHEIVGDGYGFDGDADYVHLNMGWEGTSDLWYNLPDMKEAGFNAVNDVHYNIVPHGTKSTAVISGRVLDGEDNAVAGATVRLYQNGVEVAKGVTSETGVWGFVVDEGRYDIEAVAADGLRFGVATGVELAKPSTGSKQCNGVDENRALKRKTTVPAVLTVGNAGNLWGNDITIVEPAAIIVSDDGETVNRYLTLDTALAGARQMAKAGSAETPCIQIRTPIELQKSFTADFNFTMQSEDSASVQTVANNNGAAITVAAGYTSRYLDLAFAEGETVPIRAAADGVIELGANLAVSAVDTADEGGLKVLAPPMRRVSVNCADNADLEAQFALASGALDEVAAYANMFVNANADDVWGKAVESGVDGVVRLIWIEKPVEKKNAAGYFEVNGEPSYSASLDRLFENFELNGGSTDTINLYLGGSVTRPMIVNRELTIKSELVDGALVSGIAPIDGFFTIVNGGKLTIEGVVFENYTGNGLFNVNGGEIVLSTGAVLRELTGVACELGKPNSGAVNVMKGKVTLTGGAIIDGCGVRAKYNDAKEGFGGGVYLNGADCELVLNGCLITNCFAQTYGGGVYVGSGAKVSVSGETTVAGNYKLDSANNYPADDIYLVDHANNLGNFTLAGPVVGAVGVRWGESSVDGNVDGDDLITVSGGGDMASTLPMLFSDIDSELVAIVNGGKLAWSATAKPTITVVADAKWKAVGEADPELKFRVYGLSDGDVAGDVISGSLARGEGEELGVYQISQGSLGLTEEGSEKYSLKFVGASFTIAGSVVKVPTCTDLVYNGLEQSGVEAVQGANRSGEVSEMTIGAYATVSSLAGSDSIWSDGSQAPKTMLWKITKAPTLVVRANSLAKVVNDPDPELTYAVEGLQGPDAVDGVLTGALAREEGEELGVYDILQGTLDLVNDNYAGVEFVGATFTIANGVIPLPIVHTPLVYNSEEQVGVEKADANDPYELSGDCAATEIGEYQAVATPDEEADAWKNGGVWSDGSTGPITLSWAIVGIPEAPELIPNLPANPTSGDITKALDEDSQMMDSCVKKAILASGNSVAAYNSFQTWAGGVAGGREAVCNSDQAWHSYEFGTTELFEAEPVSTFTSVTVVDPATAATKVVISVSDGVSVKAISAESVAKLFETSNNLIDWTDEVTATATDAKTGEDGTLEFTVVPTKPATPVYLRLKY